MRLVVLLAIFILFATMVTADGLPGRVWVIGIKVGVSAEGYQARNDIGVSAGEILTAFKQLQPAATVTYLLSTDNEDNNGVPTRKAIFDLLEIVGRKVAPDDRLIVYIFGQTLEEPAEDEKARQLFIPAGIDTAPEHFIANCIAFNDLLASLKNIACQERLLILDVAPVAKNKLNDPLIPDELISQAANWRVNRSATLFACGAGAFHPEVGAESFFSRTLIAGLNEASNPNTGERNLTILFQYIKEKMTKAGKKAPLLKPENVNFLFPPTEKKTGLINLNISPGEAIVKIKGTDDKEFREWKVGDELALGEYELQFECEGYYPTTQFVTVVYTDDPTPEIVTLKKKTGTLVLVTAPPDIQIFFGEEKTPQKVVNGKITNLPPGPLTVVFRKEGYYSAIKNLDIIAGKDNVINCSLIPLVRLRISASLTIDAEIFLDGESIGKVTPDQPELRSTPLASGKHIVTAKNSDYTSENKEIWVCT